jgi:hypothetical protein
MSKVPTLPTLKAPVLPAAPAAAAPPEKKAPRTTKPEYHASQAAAKEVADGRVKGARKCFEVQINGSTKYCVASHIAFVGLHEFELLGGSVTETGKQPRQKVEGIAGVMKVIDGLKEEDRLKILETLKSLARK